MGIARHAWTYTYEVLPRIQWAAKRLSGNGFSAVLRYPRKLSPTAIVPGVTTSA